MLKQVQHDIMLVDSHCHLDFPDYGSDVDEVVARARINGVGVMQTICTHITRFPQVLAVAERYDDVYCSVGIHPHHVEEEPAVTAQDIIKLTQHPKVIGIGETGLDYYYDNSPRELQKRSFLTHIEASRETGLPIIVHTRSADEDTMAIIEAESNKGAFPGLIHCFTATKQLAELAIAHGFYISISGIVTFKKAKDLQDIVRDLPLNSMLIETDAPFLAPEPYRGKRNEPAYVLHTAEFIANLKGITSEEVASVTSDNFFALFAKVPPQ